MGTVYLNCFKHKDGTKAKYRHASHYLGFTSRGVAERQREHAHGTLRHGPAALMYAVREAGLAWVTTRTWEGTRATEKELKRWGNGGRLCPHCNPRAWRHKRAGSRKPKSKRLWAAKETVCNRQD